jgi:hypothetical protein
MFIDLFALKLLWVNGDGITCKGLLEHREQKANGDLCADAAVPLPHSKNGKYDRDSRRGGYKSQGRQL